MLIAHEVLIATVGWGGGSLSLFPSHQVLRPEDLLSGHAASEGQGQISAAFLEVRTLCPHGEARGE